MHDVGDLSWSQFLGLTSKQQAVAAALLPPSARPAMLHVAAPDEPTNILFSSGTTVSDWVLYQQPEP
jgi:hypothetical protein